MVTQLQLHDLVDLALCDPEVGAVNFNHLRTLLHCMLKLSNHANETVRDCFVENIRSASSLPLHISTKNGNTLGIQSSDENNQSQHCDKEAQICDDNDSNNVVNENQKNESLHADLQKIVNAEEGYMSEADSAIVDKSLSEEDATKILLTNENTSLRKIVDNQNNLEQRILSLERSIDTFDEDFPSNTEILVEHNSEGLIVDEDDDSNVNPTKERFDQEISFGSPLKPKTSQFFQVWQNKKLLRRLEATEETVDKLFFLLNELLESKGLSNPKIDNDTDADVESIDKEKMNEYIQKVDTYQNCFNDFNDKISTLNNCVDQVKQLGIDLDEVRNSLSRVDGNDIVANHKDIDSPDDMSLLLNEKADCSELKKKVDVLEFEVKIKELLGDMSSINAKLENLNPSFNDDKTVALNSTFSDLEKRFQSFVDQSGNEFIKVHDGLSHLNQMIKKNSIQKDNGEGEIIPVNKDENYMENSELKDVINNVLIQVEKNKDFQEELSLKINDLVQVDQNLYHNLEELRMMIPSIDTSVLASLQHLSQENRNQISSLQTSLRLLKESQMIIPSNVVPDNISDKNLELLDVFQKQLLSVQDEQIKQASQVSNIVSDYKEEFNRKQLHIDALYDYIDKLQKYKADKKEVNLEMNVKADKQALDNKVNMSTFDERYQMLEQSLQQALDRIDQYAKEEDELKNEFSKLSQEMNSKMNSDTEKRLKKFLKSRLEEIEESQSKQYGEDLRNAAGMRKPMPLSFNCLSCDRPIDVRMRGVMPPVQNHMPCKNPLKKNESASNDVSYYNANRPCGGQHTSVNINMLRLTKLNPLTTPLETTTTAKKADIDVKKDLIDCVVGKDGQIYRGRYKLDGSPYSLYDHERLKTRSAKTSRRNKSKLENRPHSAELVKNSKDSI